MRQSVELRQQLRDAIEDEIAQRTDAHQRTIARLKTSTQVIAAAAPVGAPVAVQPLVMLAHGDSWFDYPLSGNDVSLDYCGWNVQQGTLIVRQALTAFNTLLAGLAADPANNFVLINTQNTLSPDDWANELHPYPNGFKNLAAHFVEALRARFPGRI